MLPLPLKLDADVCGFTMPLTLKGCARITSVTFTLQNPVTATQEGAGGSTFSQNLWTKVGMEAPSSSHAYLLASWPLVSPLFNSSRVKTAANTHRTRRLTLICQSWAQLSTLGFYSRKGPDTKPSQFEQRVACLLAPFLSNEMPFGHTKEGQRGDQGQT